MKWVKMRIEDLQLHIGDGNYSNKYPKASEFVDNGIPFISASDLSDGRIRTGKFRFIPLALHESLKKGHLKEGDVLIVTRGNGVGIVGYVDKEFEDANINAQLVLLRTDGKMIENKFLYYSLSNPFSYSQIKSFASGAAQPQLPIKTVIEIPILVPPISTQRKITGILSAYDDLIENNLKRVRLLEEKVFLRYKGIVRSEKMNEFFIEAVCETLGGGTPATGDRRFWDEGEILWFSPTDLTKQNSFVGQ